MKKILAVQGTISASVYYRLDIYLKELQKQGYIEYDTVHYLTSDYTTMTCRNSLLKERCKNLPHTEAGYTNEKDYVNFYDYDIVIFQLSWYWQILSIIKQLKSSKVYTIYECDDHYLHGIPPTNVTFRTFDPHTVTKRIMGYDGKVVKVFTTHKDKVNKVIEIFVDCVRNCDMLQVSTPELADTYCNLNDNIVVLPNYIDNSLYDKVKKKVNKKPVIGWFGTPTHLADIRLVSGCLPDNCTMKMAGDAGLNGKIFTEHGDTWVTGTYPLEGLPEISSEMDIGITPLVDCKFNRGKSELKGIEFGAMGIPVVASRVAPYERWVEHGINGYFASKTKHWIKYLKLLVNDRELRIKMGKANKAKAIKRDIKNNLDIFKEAYRL